MISVVCKGALHHLLFLLRLGVHIDVHIPGSVQLLKFLKLVLLSQCLTFYQHNNTSKEREDNYYYFNNVSFFFTFSQIISLFFPRFLTFDVVPVFSPELVIFFFLQ